MDSINNKNITINPFDRAKYEWDMRIGTNVVRARNWRLLAFIQAIIIVMALALIITQYNNLKVFYVYTDSNGASTVERVAQSIYDPNINQLRYNLINFVEKLHTVSCDNAINDKFFIQAYAYLTSDIVPIMQQLITNRQKLINKQYTRQIKITLFSKVTESTFQIQWQELIFTADGNKLSDKKKNTLITIALSPPKEEKSIYLNPLGIWITGYDEKECLS